jgi:2-polyprenyl-3-methyl-5-hydroxy-6-metoxy-1,4-benzoquinol methylase
MQLFHDLPSMQTAVSSINAREYESQRIEGLCEIAYCPNVDDMIQLDPFSAAYKTKVVEVYQSVAKRSQYSPDQNELSPYLDSVSELRPGYYTSGSTAFVGDILTAMDQVLISLNAKPNQKILEYGAGEGGIALEAAKAGCEVTIVDIEPKYLALVERRAKAAGVNIRTVLGEFGCDCGQGFDRILFYEAFHHALDHANVAAKLHSMLAPTGYLVLAGEPVMGAHNAKWRPTLPYPWGLRLDGLSFRAIQTYGWMELGFDESYLVEMLMRAGFLVQFHPCAATTRGSSYIARPTGTELNLGENFIIAAHGRAIDEWHSGEGSHRWTALEEVVLPLRHHQGMVGLALINHGGTGQSFEIESAGSITSGTLSPGEVRTIKVPASSRLCLRSQIRSAGGADTRKIGLAVKSVKYL